MTTPRQLYTPSIKGWIDSCQDRASADKHHMTVSWASSLHVSRCEMSRLPTQKWNYVFSILKLWMNIGPAKDRNRICPRTSDQEKCTKQTLWNLQSWSFTLNIVNVLHLKDAIKFTLMCTSHGGMYGAHSMFGKNSVASKQWMLLLFEDEITYWSMDAIYFFGCNVQEKNLSFYPDWLCQEIGQS